MNLTNVARSSIDEVRKDYLKYLTRRKLPVWTEGEALFAEARNLRPNSLEAAAAWVNRRRAGTTAEERAANLGAILATQAHWLTERLLDRQAKDFESDGGFSERLYKARSAKRGMGAGGAVRSVSSGEGRGRGAKAGRPHADRTDGTDTELGADAGGGSGGSGGGGGAGGSDGGLGAGGGAGP